MTSTRIEAGWEWLNRLVTSDTFVYVVKAVAGAFDFVIQRSHFHHPASSGDYLDTLKQKISPERIEDLRQQFGLDRSWPEQYGRWLWRILTQGDWNEFCLSTLCGIAVVGAVGSNTTTSARIFNCYLGDRYSPYHRRSQTKSLIDRFAR